MRRITAALLAVAAAVTVSAVVVGPASADEGPNGPIVCCRY